MPRSDSDPEDSAAGLFADPPDFYPPSPKATFATHRLLSGTELTLRLVGHNPLWGHHLWQAGRIISHHLESNPSIVKGKTVLELGAGAGLPSLVSSILGAKKVVVTDYPDVDLIQNLQFNIDNCPLLKKEDGSEIVAEGYLWGADPESLLKNLSEDNTASESSSRGGFDMLILADLLFNHSEHKKLLTTISSTLKKSSFQTQEAEAEAKALVFFTPYRPWLFEKDMAFFDLCRGEGYVVEKILEEKMEKVMFEEDRGDEELRRTVFGFVVRRKRDGEVVDEGRDA